MTKDIRLIIIILFQILVGVAVILFQKNSHVDKNSSEQFRIQAAKLESVGVLDEAVKSYESYLEQADVGNTEKAKVAYSLGALNERIGKFERAVKWYYDVEMYDPSSTLKDEAAKNVVAVLEKLQKYSAANMVLSEKTALNPSIHKEGRVVAKINGKELYDYEFNEFLDLAPIKDEKTKDKKAQLLQAFVADRIIFEHAVKLGFDKDPELRRKLMQIEKQLITSKVYEKEIQPKIKLDETDLENYYKTNKDKFKKAYKEVKEEVKQAYVMEKAQRLYSELVQEKIKTEQVELMPENIK